MFRLVECEFPPLQALNKLGDGSLQSSNQVDSANLQFALQACRALSAPFGDPPTLLTSAAATASFVQRAQKAYSRVQSLKDGKPAIGKKGQVFVLVAPSSTRDYGVTKQLATDGATVVLINGFAKVRDSLIGSFCPIASDVSLFSQPCKTTQKDNKSVSEQATMAYFLKPLTYNSQVAGYLLRAYPQPWTTLDAATGAILETATDAQILVRNTNTPDLRTAVKAVQQSVDQRAIAARQRQQQ